MDITPTTQTALDVRIAKARKAWLEAVKRESAITTLTITSKQRSLEQATERAYAKLNALLAQRKEAK
jgi:hypothetical protein